MPAPAHALPEPPHLLGGRNGDNVADDLVSGDPRVLDGLAFDEPLLDALVAVNADGISEDGRHSRQHDAFCYLPQTPQASTFTTTSFAWGSFHGTVIFCNFPTPRSVSA